MPLTITSTFSPMTYDELARPLVEQTNLHMQLEDQYSAINDKAAAMEAKANEQTDPIAYQQLKAYSESLKLQADQLMKVGLQRTSRQSLLDMKRRYNKEVLPVEEAYTRRKELAEEQRKLQVQNPDLLFERQAGNMSLDTFLANPQADYGHSYSGAEITKRVGTLVQTAAQGIQRLKLGQSLDPYTQTIIKEAGFSPAEIEEAIRGGASTESVLARIRDGVLQSTGVNEWGDAATRQRALEYANEGLRYGSMKVDVSAQPDFKARTDYSAAKEVSVARQKAAIDLANYKEKTRYAATFSTPKGADQTLGGVTAHQVDSAADGTPLYQDNDGNYYTLDKDASGKVKGYVPTNKRPKESSTTATSKVPIISNPVSIITSNSKGRTEKIGQVTIYDSKDLPGGLNATNYGSLSKDDKQLVNTQIGNSDPSNYNFYTYEIADPESIFYGDNTQILIVPNGKQGVVYNEDDDIY